MSDTDSSDSESLFEGEDFEETQDFMMDTPSPLFTDVVVKEYANGEIEIFGSRLWLATKTWESLDGRRKKTPDGQRYYRFDKINKEKVMKVLNDPINNVTAREYQFLTNACKRDVQVAEMIQFRPRPSTEFQMFVKDHRATILALHPAARCTEISRLLVQAWATEDSDTKNKYLAQATQERVKYHTELTAARHEFFKYYRAIRNQLKQEHPSWKIDQMQREAAKRWLKLKTEQPVAPVVQVTEQPSAPIVQIAEQPSPAVVKITSEIQAALLKVDQLAIATDQVISLSVKHIAEEIQALCVYAAGMHLSPDEYKNLKDENTKLKQETEKLRHQLEAVKIALN